MSIDPRLIDIGTTADEREPVAVYEDQVTVIVDNLMAAYWRDPGAPTPCSAETAT